MKVEVGFVWGKVKGLVPFEKKEEAIKAVLEALDFPGMEVVIGVDYQPKSWYFSLIFSEWPGKKWSEEKEILRLWGYKISEGDMEGFGARLEKEIKEILKKEFAFHQSRVDLLNTALKK